MEKESHRNEGLVRMIERGKEMFNTTENVDFYSEKDYRQAEKKFIKYCVIGRKCG